MENPHNGKGKADELVEHTRELRHNARQVADDLRHIYSSASDRVNLGQLYRQNPYMMLGVAAGVGYLLGGGLFTPFTSRLLRIGTRAVLIPLATAQLDKMLTGGEITANVKSSLTQE